ncbi:MAG: rhomboid family intramembrane serine protease [Micrococcales bacterium]|nr:rhomboid family intramembrane serine protease [Micrococcales bacterium]
MSDQPWGTPSDRPDGVSDGAPVPADAVPVCPRHRDRASYVRCQRCGRPVCPQCQRPAPVGIQCVDCVNVGTRAAAPRATFGEGRVSDRPVVTLTLIGLCVVAFVAQMAVPGFTHDLQFVPRDSADEPWRFLSAAFLHSTEFLLHIVFNMLALWMVGPFLEASLGRARFVTLYLLSALGGSVGMLVAAKVTSPVLPTLPVLAHTLWYVEVVGASGAVFGLFGAVLVVLRRTGRSAQGIVGVLVINGVLGFVVPHIAWQAHLGGLVVGAALGAAYAYAPRARRREVSLAASLAVALALVLVAVGIYQSVGLL